MSKDLFLMMREQEIQTQNFLPNKKEIQFSAKEFITEILDAGEGDKFELFAQAKRMSEALEVVTAKLLESLPQENFEAFGLKGTFRNGGSVLNYSEDFLWAELNEKLKERAELLKLASKSKDSIYDSNGIEVTRCSSTERKSSLSISF